MRILRATVRWPRIAVVAAAAAAAAHAADPVKPAPGLEAAVHASWTRLPLRDWAERTAKIAGEPVILDRRLDPTTTITLDCRGEPLRQVMATVAAQAGAEVDELRSTIRLVPRDRAGLAASADEALAGTVTKMTAPVRRRASAREAWAWPDGARPRELVSAAAREAGVAIEGIDTIPHDHFPAADLPPLSLAERLDLVLAHFDRRVQWEVDQAAGRIVAIDDGIPPRAAAGKRPDARAAARPRTTVRLKDAFTLRVEAPLDQTLAAIAKRLDLRLDLDVASLQARGIATGEIIRADVKDVSRNDLLRAILAPLGLDWQIEADTLRVFAPPR